MAKQTWYQNLSQMTAGMTTGFVNAFNAIFPGVQNELELRESLFSGFYEPLAVGAGLAITGNASTAAAVNLSWPARKGAILNGIRIAPSGAWAFSTQAAGTYYLYLDSTGALLALAATDSRKLLVATVTWMPSTLTLSALTLSTLATNAPTLMIANQTVGGGAGTVTSVNSETPDSSGDVTVDVADIPYAAPPSGSGWSSLSTALSAMYATVTSGLTVAWGSVTGKPSSFTPAAHASTHGSSGADPVSPAAIGALATSALVQSVGDPGSGSNVPSEAAVYSAIAQAISGLANGLVYKGLWNALTNNPAIASSTGTLGWFYKVSVAGTTVVDGNSDWKVGDIIIFDGVQWDRLAGYEAVSSVFGRTGPVTAQTNDYDVAQIAYATPPIGSGWTSLVAALAAIYTAITATVSVAWGNVSGKPSSFTPSAHESTHQPGGSDALIIMPTGSGWTTFTGALAAIYTAIATTLPNAISAAVTGMLTSIGSSTPCTNAPGLLKSTWNGTTGYVSTAVAGTDYLAPSSSITTQGNSFNGANQLVEADGNACVPFAQLGYALQAPCLGDVTTLPTSGLTVGNRYLYTGTGAHANCIAQCSSASGPVWTYTSPTAGMSVMVGSASPLQEYVFDGTAWVLQLGGAAEQYGAFAQKSAPATGDLLLIEDSAASYAKKYINLAALAFPMQEITPVEMLSPVNNDAAVNVIAPTQSDANNPSLLVRAFNYGTNSYASGALFTRHVPVGATNLVITIFWRPQSTAGSTLYVQPTLYARSIGTSVPAWSSDALSLITIPSGSTAPGSTTYTIPLATLGITAGYLVQFELVRACAGSDSFTGSWGVLHVQMQYA